MASVITTTPNLGLNKQSLGHSMLDTYLAENADLIDAEYDRVNAVFNGNVKVIKGDLTAGIADAFAFAVQNPESVRCHILQVVVDVTTAGGTATSVLDVDVGATATATGDTIFDGIDLNATGISSSINVSDTGTNGDESIHGWDELGGTNDYLTGKILVETAADVVGKYYIYYVTV